MNGPSAGFEPPPDQGWRLLLDFLDRFKDDLLFIAIATIAAFVRAMGITVESGQTGLLFTLGRAKRELPPGFHLLVPFLQSARRVPTRSRTMDLPAQRVMTFEGLVYVVDANLVYRVTDVRKALIEVDDLERGMRQMLGLGVQEVVRAASRAEIASAGALDERFVATLQRRLAQWGVTIESAGFPSIHPSPRTLRVTQLAETVEARRAQWASLAGRGTDPAVALGLVGTRAMPRRRATAMRRFVRANRRVLRLHKRLAVRGWNGAAIKKVEIRVLDHIASKRRPAVFQR